MTATGIRAAAAQRFIDEVRSSDTDWPRLAQTAKNPQASAAIEALTLLPWPAALLSSVDKAARRAYGALDLSAESFPNPLAKNRVKIAITTAAQAIAMKDELASEHLEALLRPFATAGFASAREVLGETGDRFEQSDAD